MGLIFEFYAGDADKIVAALKDSDFRKLKIRAVVTCSADLSLHIGPDDLDLLSQTMGEVAGLEPMDLLSHMLSVCDDDTDFGISEVSMEWVTYAAAVPDTQIPEVALGWAKAMSKEHGTEIKVNDDVTRSVGELLTLCKRAKRENLQVLHFWSL